MAENDFDQIVGEMPKTRQNLAALAVSSMGRNRFVAAD
jgi:hypothetical protein